MWLRLRNCICEVYLQRLATVLLLQVYKTEVSLLNFIGLGATLLFNESYVSDDPKAQTKFGDMATIIMNVRLALRPHAYAVGIVPVMSILQLQHLGFVCVTH